MMSKKYKACRGTHVVVVMMMMMMMLCCLLYMRLVYYNFDVHCGYRVITEVSMFHQYALTQHTTP